jgi:hypothetical protein
MLRASLCKMGLNRRMEDGLGRREISLTVSIASMVCTGRSIRWAEKPCTLLLHFMSGIKKWFFDACFPFICISRFST